MAPPRLTCMTSCVRWVVAVSVALGCAAGLSACASGASDNSPASAPSTTAASVTHPPTGPYFVGAITRTIDYNEGSIVLTPPGRKAPALTWRQAIAHCRGQGCITGSAPEVSLALATTLRSGTVRHDGSAPAGTDHALTYVLTARHHGCDVPAGPVASEGGSDDSGDCTFVQLIDADTGRVGYAMSGHLTVTGS